MLCRSSLAFRFRVCAGHFLHPVYNKAFPSRQEIHRRQNWPSVLRLVCPQHHKAVGPGFAFQHHSWVLQNLGDLFNFRQRHLRVVLQDLSDLVPLHVNVALDGPQALQHRPCAAQGKAHALRHIVLYPAVDLVREILPDLPPALRRSGLLHRPPAIPGGVHQGVVPNLLQLPGVLHHGATLRPVRLQALQGDLQVFHPFPQPVPDLFRQAAVFLCQLLHHRAVPQHHLAGVSHHLVHGLVVLKARLPALLVRHQILKAHALLMGQLIYHEGLQRLILGAVGLDEVGQLVGGGLQDGRLGHAHGVPPGVDVQVQLAALVKAVGTLVYAPLVGLALIEYHVNAHRP